MRTGVSVALAAAVLLSACSGAQTDIAAVVDGQPIPLDRVSRMVTAVAERPEVADLQGQERIAAVADLQRRVLTDLIRRSIIDQAAEQRGIDVTEEEIDQAREQQLQRAGSEEAARALSPGLTDQEVRARLATEVRERKLFEQVTGEVEVTDEEVAAAYREQRDRFETARVSHILVETEQEAQAILDLLDQGADFADLARERSQDGGTAADGGALGTAPRGSYVAPFDEAVWAADQGEVVGPVQTRFGYHVIRVEEFERVPLEEAAPRLREQLRQQAVRERFDRFEQELFADADVDLAERFGRYDPESATVVPTDEFAPAPAPSPASSPAGPLPVPQRSP